ncbi:MAG: hypothetical protein QXQ94_10615 [Candidatus Bathyarchaeia archaeon]
MSWMLSEKWLWIIIVLIIIVFTLPGVVVWFILTLPIELKFLSTILIIIGWGIAAGYKDWILAKRQEEENRAMK